MELLVWGINDLGTREALFGAQNPHFWGSAESLRECVLCACNCMTFLCVCVCGVFISSVGTHARLHWK